MKLNETGKMADEVWSSMFRFLEDVDTWIVMPNHLHGIVAIGGDHARSAGKPLGRLVGAFKTATTKRINEISGVTRGAVIWQRNFYEHIIRDDRSFENIAAYIRDNPARWDSDPENPIAQDSERDARERLRTR